MKGLKTIVLKAKTTAYLNSFRHRIVTGASQDLSSTLDIVKSK